MPPANDKRFWKRYIYLWINYAVFEESLGENGDRACSVYEKVLSIVPHEIFTFAKLWILYAQYLVRKQDIEKARKVFG